MTTPNYKESAVTGTTWQRAYRVVIENPYGGTPTVNFLEETILSIGDELITKPCSNLALPYSPDASFPLLDPTTGEVSTDRPSMTHGELYAVLNSLYMHLASQRDASQTITE